MKKRTTQKKDSIKYVAVHIDSKVRDKLKAFCKKNGFVMAKKMEFAISEWLEKQKNV